MASLNVFPGLHTIVLGLLMSFTSLGSSVEQSFQNTTLNPVRFRFRWRDLPFSSMRSIRLNPYSLVILATMFGFILRLAIDPWLGDQMPYITFLVAVALVGLFGGVRPALVSTALGTVTAYFCFVPPRYHLGFQGVSDAAGFFAYLAAALGIVLLTGARTKAYAAAEARWREQLAAEGKLRDAQKVFELFMDNRPGFSYLRQRDGQYVYFNRAARHFLGLNDPGSRLPKVVSELQEQDEQAFNSDTPLQFINKIDLSDGERYWLTTKFTFVNDEQRVFVGSVSTDVTDQVKAEEAAIERERLIAAGKMMATVAHEVNNPLAAVTSSVYLLTKETLPERAKELTDIAQHELARLAHITRRVLGFYNETEHPVAVDPCDLVRSVLNALSSRFSETPRQIAHDFKWEGSLVLQARQAREMLENLLQNSFESGASRIRVRIRRSKNWRDLSRSGCRISIFDDGRGISPEHQTHAFEPFFSTKTQKGSGIGLWISKAIVLRNGGTISLRTTEDRARHGTCISVFLPQRILPEVAKEIAIRKSVSSVKPVRSGSITADGNNSVKG
jgi:signal transduction histidine kinase